MGPNLAIDAGSGRHAISPSIYGLIPDYYSYNQTSAFNPTILRFDGYHSNQYNWQTGDYNSGSYSFENYHLDNNGIPDFDEFVRKNNAVGAQSMGTIPINGWLARDDSSCAFSIAKYGQQVADGFDANGDCGFGILPDLKTPITQVSIGKCTTPPCTDPADADIAVNPGFMQEWVAHTVSAFGSSANGGVAIWQLDNEPVWWSNVHQNIHPVFPTRAARATRATTRYGRKA